MSFDLDALEAAVLEGEKKGFFVAPIVKELITELRERRAQVDGYRMMIDGLENAAHEERAAVVAYLRKQANAPHPIERGVPSLSPAGRGLLLLHADRFERGEHRREEKP